MICPVLSSPDLQNVPFAASVPPQAVRHTASAPPSLPWRSAAGQSHGGSCARPSSPPTPEAGQEVTGRAGSQGHQGACSTRGKGRGRQMPLGIVEHRSTEVDFMANVSGCSAGHRGSGNRDRGHRTTWSMICRVNSSSQESHR